MRDFSLRILLGAYLAIRFTKYPCLSKSDTIAGFRSISPPWSITKNLFCTFRGVLNASHLFSHFSGGFSHQEYTCHNFPMIWLSIIRYAGYPFILVSISVLYLLCYFWIVKPQYRLSPYFNFSENILVLPYSDTVLLIFQLNHKSQPSRSVSEEKVGRPFTPLLIIPVPFLFIWNIQWCHRTLVSSILS